MRRLPQFVLPLTFTETQFKLSQLVKTRVYPVVEYRELYAYYIIAFNHTNIILPEMKPTDYYYYTYALYPELYEV